MEVLVPLSAFIYALFNTNGTVWHVNGHSTWAVICKLNLGNS